MFDVHTIIQSGGVLLVAAIIFAESGLLAGFFLPGDTLLFSAGFFASQGKLPVSLLLGLVIISAILGYIVGYHIGKKFGKRLFSKKDGIIFKQEYLQQSELFYEKHGGKTILLSRFVPLIRTFAPVTAGIGGMEYRRFMVFNIAGAILWGGGVTLLGYFLGSRIPNIDKYILPIILIAMFVTFAPTALHIGKSYHTRSRNRRQSK